MFTKLIAANWTSLKYIKNYDNLNQFVPYQQMIKMHVDNVLEKAAALQAERGRVVPIRILEAGAGTGNITLAVASNLLYRSIPFKYVAFDHDDNMRAAGAKKLARLNLPENKLALYPGDLTKPDLGLPVLLHKSDVIIMNNVLYLFPDDVKYAILHNLSHNYLANNGIFLLCEPKAKGEFTYLDMLKPHLKHKGFFHTTFFMLPKLLKLQQGEKDLINKKFMISGLRQKELLVKAGFNIYKIEDAYGQANKYFSCSTRPS